MKSDHHLFVFSDLSAHKLSSRQDAVETCECVVTQDFCCCCHPPTWFQRNVTSTVSLKKYPNTRIRRQCFVKDGLAMTDFTCTTYSITTQHGSCTNSCRLLLDRDKHNQSFVVGNLGVGRKNLTISILTIKTAATTKTTADCSNVQTVGRRKRDKEEEVVRDL